jgi:hypothetical protein
LTTRPARQASRRRCIARRAHSSHRGGGRNDLEHGTSTGFTDVFAVTDYTDTDTSRDPRRTAELLQHIGTQIGSRFATLA